MIVVDINVFSELTKPAPHPRVQRWFLANRTDINLCSVVVFEALSGAEQIRDRTQRKTVRAVYRALFDRVAKPVLVLDKKAAITGAEMIGSSRRSGVALSGADAMIAGIAKQNRAALATRNAKDFKATGLTLIDPWNAP